MSKTATKPQTHGPWCGACDQTTRWAEDPTNGNPLKCRVCHRDHWTPETQMRAHAAVNPAPKHPPVRHDPYLGRQRAYENTGEWWKSCARAAIKQLARSHPDGFTSDDLRRFPGLPDPDTEKRWGAILNAAARGDDPVTEDTGTRRASTLPSANGRKVIVWIGTAKYRSAAA